MCLAILALGAHPDWPLVIAANRDEFHHRPASPAAPWSDAPDIVAGRDLQGGGTWLGVAGGGRLALLTNVREPGRQLPAAPSRGRLVEDYLRGSLSAADYAGQFNVNADEFNGFNLLVADLDGVHYCSNRALTRRLPSTGGGFGLSNAALDTPWPKLTRSRAAVAALLSTSAQPEPEALFAILGDRTPPEDGLLPDTGVGLQLERLLGSPFIQSETYGTRCSTLVLQHRSGRVEFRERCYRPTGEVQGESVWTRALGTTSAKAAGGSGWV